MKLIEYKKMRICHIWNHKLVIILMIMQVKNKMKVTILRIIWKINNKNVMNCKMKYQKTKKIQIILNKMMKFKKTKMNKMNLANFYILIKIPQNKKSKKKIKKNKINHKKLFQTSNKIKITIKSKYLNGTKVIIVLLLQLREKVIQISLLNKFK